MNLRTSIRSATSGFTLVELILAVGVAAIVLAAINGVFFSAMRLRDSTTRAVEASLPLQRAVDLLRRDLQNAMPPLTNGVFSGTFKAGQVLSTGLNQPVDLELCTTTGALKENEPWGEVQRVDYSLRPPSDASAVGKDLIRSVTRNLLSTVPASPDDQSLLGGVESIEYACYDGYQWRGDWDTSVTDTNLPSAIRVRIRLAGPPGGTAPEPIEFTVPVDAQPRTLPTATN